MQLENFSYSCIEYQNTTYEKIKKNKDTLPTHRHTCFLPYPVIGGDSKANRNLLTIPLCRVEIRSPCTTKWIISVDLNIYRENLEITPFMYFEVSEKCSILYPILELFSQNQHFFFLALPGDFSILSPPGQGFL